MKLPRDRKQEPPFSPAETIELVRRAKAGEALALDQLVARVLPRIQRWAHGRLPRGARNMLDTGDIVQEVLVNSLRQLENFEPRGPGAFVSYLRRGLVNRLEDERRKLACRPAPGEMPDDVMATGASPLEHAVRREQHARYEAALAQLEETERAAIIGRFEWGYSYAELAIVLAKPSDGAARQSVLRAVQRLLLGMRRTYTASALTAPDS